MGKSRKSSFRNNLLVAFLLAVTVLGVSVAITSNYVLRNTLYEAGLDDESVTKIGREFVATNTGLTIAAVILSLFIAAFLSRAISRRVAKLNEAVRELTSGNLDARVSIAGEDEFTELARGFNEMAAALKQARDYLEKKVAERTRDLSQTNARLEEEIEERQAIQQELEDRVREINCLFSLSHLLENRETELKEVLVEVVETIRTAYRSIDNTAVRITYQGQSYQSDNFVDSEICQHAPLRIEDREAGRISVCYIGPEDETATVDRLNGEGRILEIVAEQISGIAEHKLSEHRLRLFRNLLDQSNEAVFVIDPATARLLDVNDRACESLQYSREHLLDMQVPDIDAEIAVDRQSWLKWVDLAADREFLTIETSHRRSNGTVFPVEITAKIIRQDGIRYVLAVGRDITQRKAAEAQIRAQASFLDQDPAPSLRSKYDGEIIAHNPAAEEAFGAPLEGRSLYDLFDWLEKPYLAELSESEPSQTEQTVGSKTFLLTFKKDAETKSVYLYSSDISDRKQTERQLAASEEKYRRLVEDLGPEYFFYKHDTEGRFTYVSRSAREVLGYEEDEFAASYSELLTDNPVNADCIRHTELSIQGIEQPTYEAEVRDVNGETHLLEVTEHPVFENDRVVAVEGIAHDITQRSKTDQALRKSREQLSERNEFLNTILESLTHPFYVVDAETFEIKMANTAFEKGFWTGDVTCYACTHGRTEPCTLSQDECPIEIIKKTRKPVTVEHIHKDKSGREMYIEIHGYPVFDRQGEVSEIIEYAVDITERKLFEQRQNRLLKRLATANKDLKDFAYIVSHDLKAPLRGIATLASWIESDCAETLSPQSTEHLEMLTGRVKKMEKLIDGVLAYSRVSRSEEAVSRVDLNKLVADVIEMVSPPENIRIEIEDRLPTVKCGRTRIEQVFQNLISNAVKYMDKPQGVIRIACESEDDSWLFSIADNGPGIEKQYFDKIFDIFQTLQPGDESESSGVGLTVAKKIVEMYGGRIWVESTPGKGSTFYFTLKKKLSSQRHRFNLEDI